MTALHRVDGRVVALFLVFVVVGLAPDRAAPESACPADVVSTARAEPRDACIQEKQDVISRVIDLVRAYQGGCQRDRDCVLVETSIPCQSGCQMAVLRSRQQTFRHTLNAYAEVCRRTSTECGIEGRCPPVSRATCVRGTCQPDIPGVR